MLGPDFAAADTYPTRVRLPAAADAGRPHYELGCHTLSMGTGNIVTSTRGQRRRVVPRSQLYSYRICVESGQADLFLAGVLGIDLQTKGLATYRLLDAEVTFHQALPKAGSIITYDIYGDGFSRQGETYLYRFHYDATVDGKPLLSMRGGTAGFFTQAELDAGVGIIHSALDQRAQPGIITDNYQPLLPVTITDSTIELDSAGLDALRSGDLGAAFGAPFDQLPLQAASRLPGGEQRDRRLRLVDRITGFTAGAGKYGLGEIRGELDIEPDAWFLTCHFMMTC